MNKNSMVIDQIERQLDRDFFCKIDDYKAEYGKKVEFIAKCLHEFINEKNCVKRYENCGGMFRIISDDDDFFRSQAGVTICKLIDPKLYEDLTDTNK